MRIHTYPDAYTSYFIYEVERDKIDDVISCDVIIITTTASYIYIVNDIRVQYTHITV